MSDKLFLGVADNNHHAVAVVGDAAGRIVATSMGKSASQLTYGVRGAEDNLRSLLAEAFGNCDPSLVKKACFTYKPESKDKATMYPVIREVLPTWEIQLESFSRSCSLGMKAAGDRLFLVGSEVCFVVFEDDSGMRFKIQADPLLANLQRCLRRKAGRNSVLGGGQELRNITKLSHFACLITALDQAAQAGNLLALEVVHELAHNLVSLVIKASKHFNNFEPVIALYGQIFFKSSLVYDRVRYLIELVYPQAQILEGTLIPAKGAYFSSLVSGSEF